MQSLTSTARFSIFQWTLIFLSILSITCLSNLSAEQETIETLFSEEETPTDVEEIKREMSLQERLTNFFGTFVTSSPYPGVRTSYEGSELMVRISNVNKDLQILFEQRDFIRHLDAKGFEYPDNPRMFLSGQVEAAGFIRSDALGKARSDIDLVQAEIDFLTIINSWVIAFISMDYDRDFNLESRYRIDNSRVHIDNAFATLGNLERFPIYATFGQVYPAFGQYTSFGVHLPITTLLFRQLQREVSLGFNGTHTIASAYTFKGDSHEGSGNNIQNYGFNFGAKTCLKGDGSASIAFGMIRNIADSQGMQDAFGNTLYDNRLRHLVPGFDVNANVTYRDITILLEYITALRPFNPIDMAFSQDGVTFKGAKVSAFNMEFAYKFAIKEKPTSLSFGFSESKQALGFNAPRRRYMLTLSSHVASGCLVSCEWLHNTLYKKHNRASGKVIPGNPYYMNPKHLGHSDNEFTLDILVYW